MSAVISRSVRIYILLFSLRLSIGHCKAGKAPGGRTLLEFDAALCRDCGTCTDTCRYGAISCEETLTVSELFALEPRAIVIPKRRVLPSRR